jgi:hypothetical protein
LTGFNNVVGEANPANNNNSINSTLPFVEKNINNNDNSTNLPITNKSNIDLYDNNNVNSNINCIIDNTEQLNPMFVGDMNVLNSNTVFNDIVMEADVTIMDADGAMGMNMDGESAIDADGVLWVCRLVLWACLADGR